MSRIKKLLTLFGLIGGLLSPIVLAVDFLNKLQERKKTEIEMQKQKLEATKLARDLDIVSRLEIKLSASELKPPNANASIVLARAEIKNSGSDDVFIRDPNMSFELFKVIRTNASSGELRLDPVKSYPILQGDRPVGELSLFKGTSRLVEVPMLPPTSGLYAISFEASKSDAERNEEIKRGANVHHRSLWGNTMYFQVKNPTSRVKPRNPNSQTTSLSAMNGDGERCLTPNARTSKKSALTPIDFPES